MCDLPLSSDMSQMHRFVERNFMSCFDFVVRLCMSRFENSSDVMAVVWYVAPCRVLWQVLADVSEDLTASIIILMISRS
jgi:hypothetical protein